MTMAKRASPCRKFLLKVVVVLPEETEQILRASRPDLGSYNASELICADTKMLLRRFLRGTSPGIPIWASLILSKKAEASQK
jgi:hypothetical protein